mmetsp:Transcript_15923/g.34975  ORF Transcript_15923/g.34975 Transcript_15923/m.34975 type:complete len:293 (+) Transcript_15923:216-1094(+)
MRGATATAGGRFGAEEKSRGPRSRRAQESAHKRLDKESPQSFRTDEDVLQRHHWREPTAHQESPETGRVPQVQSLKQQKDAAGIYGGEPKAVRAARDGHGRDHGATGTAQGEDQGPDGAAQRQLASRVDRQAHLGNVAEETEAGGRLPQNRERAGRSVPQLRGGAAAHRETGGLPEPSAGPEAGRSGAQDGEGVCAGSGDHPSRRVGSERDRPRDGESGADAGGEGRGAARRALLGGEAEEAVQRLHGRLQSEAHRPGRARHGVQRDGLPARRLTDGQYECASWTRCEMILS